MRRGDPAFRLGEETPPLLSLACKNVDIYGALFAWIERYASNCTPRQSKR